MNNIYCHSIRDNQDVDFHQLSTIVRNIRIYLNSFKTKQGYIGINSFEIPQQLVTPLENLDDLLVKIFKETETEISKEQRQYLTVCEQMVTIFYCYIHHFIVEINNSKGSSETSVDKINHTKKYAHEFYFNAGYELRTPYYILKGYNEPLFLMHMSQIYSPPFVPENQDKLDKINYWIDELGKFLDDLPSLWKANQQEDAA